MKISTKSKLKLRVLWQVLTLSVSKLYSQMYVDPVTKVLNRKAFELASYTQIAIVDMDSLKYINDNIGHEEGDRFLKELASYLVRVFGEGNVFRLGGDEFAVTSNDSIEKIEFSCALFFACDANKTFSYGVGTTLKQADIELNIHKTMREELGLRTGRGECPPWMMPEQTNVIDFIDAKARLNRNV